MTDKKEKEMLLLKPIWSLKDIKNYFGISYYKARELRALAEKNGGSCKYSNCHVSSDVVLNLCETNRKKELSLINQK